MTIKIPCHCQDPAEPGVLHRVDGPCQNVERPRHTGHAIELRLDGDGVYAFFNCHEGSKGKCHETCAEDCPVWTDECMTTHDRKFIDYCNPIEFIDNSGFWYETYIGKETEPRSGPIVFEWQSDEWYGWKYADEQ